MYGDKGRTEGDLSIMDSVKKLGKKIHDSESKEEN